MPTSTRPAALALFLFASTAVAQSATQPQSAPPPAPPPTGYVQPYPYPYGAPQAAPTSTWRPGDWSEGDVVPPGYHVEEKPRRGLVTAGWIVTSTPYGLGVIAASSANFQNESTWLVLPIAGPWMTLGRRHYGCAETSDPNVRQSLTCVGDVFAVMGLVADGVVQLTGGTLLLLGYTLTKPTLVRDGTSSLHVGPTRVGSGYGVGAFGAF